MSIADPAYEIVPATRLRRLTARKMRASVTEKPPVTLHRTVDGTALKRLLDALRADPAPDRRPTLTSVLAILVARALIANPVLNAHLVDDELRRFAEVHLAVAVATDVGLVPPVLRPDDLRDVGTATHRLTEVAGRARAGRLSPEDLAPATFTLTSLGAWGIEYFTPILNPPQIGILGVGALASQANGDGATHRLPLSLTFDHAAVDGVAAAQFLETLNQLIADPKGMCPAMANDT